MKSITATAVLGLAAMASASPSARAASHNVTSTGCIVPFAFNTSSTTAITSSLNQWLVDVVTLNDFVDTFAAGGYNSSALIRSAATTVKLNSDDESCQYATLSSTSDVSNSNSTTDAFKCAVYNLPTALNEHVQTPLNDIISYSGNSSLVHDRIDEINRWRCCNTLSAASILWTDTIVDYSLYNLNATAPIPKACASITCTQVCAGKSNSGYDYAIAIIDSFNKTSNGS